MGDLLPPLPTFRIGTQRTAFSADEMRAYADEAVKQEREAILAAIDDLDEPAWYGYENPNTFNDGKWAAAAAIRARSEQLS